MISFDFGTSQIKRLTGLRRFPAEREAAKELVLALQTADDDETARRVVDDVLAVHTDCPVPAQIREAARVINQRSNPIDPLAQFGPKPAVCRRCNGYGTIGEAPAVTFCTCSDGVQVKQHPKLGIPYLEILNRRLSSSPVRFDRKSTPRRKELSHA